jgi:hypothetical protein
MVDNDRGILHFVQEDGAFKQKVENEAATFAADFLLLCKIRFKSRRFIPNSPQKSCHFERSGSGMRNPSEQKQTQKAGWLFGRLSL